MMWRLFHNLFGWHYVLAENSCVTIVRRVRKMPNGEVMFCWFGDNWYSVNSRRWNVTPLTWKNDD